VAERDFYFGVVTYVTRTKSETSYINFVMILTFTWPCIMRILYNKTN